MCTHVLEKQILGETPIVCLSGLENGSWKKKGHLPLQTAPCWRVAHAILSHLPWNTVSIGGSDQSTVPLFNPSVTLRDPTHVIYVCDACARVCVNKHTYMHIYLCTRESLCIPTDTFCIFTDGVKPAFKPVFE